jgi:hypothetical protein
MILSFFDSKFWRQSFFNDIIELNELVNIVILFDSFFLKFLYATTGNRSEMPEIIIYLKVNYKCQSFQKNYIGITKNVSPAGLSILVVRLKSYYCIYLVPNRVAVILFEVDESNEWC